MKYIIGVDAGGTKTECILANTDGKVLSKTSAKGGNPLVIGIKNTAKNILSSIKKCNKKLKVNFKDVEMLVVGSTGMGRKKDADNLLAELKKILKIKKIKVTTDAQIALEGAFSNKPGCILIAGTGSIIYGKDKKGNLYRAGGFGRLLGDFGGGYSIGRKGLIAAAKELDGNSKKTLLTKLLRNEFHIKNSGDLISNVYKSNFPIQDFTPLVIKAAEKKDKTSRNILEEEAEELLELIISLRKKIKIRKMKLSFAGSLISNKNYYSDLLKTKIKKNLKFVDISSPENTPAVGAILIAKKYLGIK